MAAGQILPQVGVLLETLQQHLQQNKLHFSAQLRTLKLYMLYCTMTKLQKEHVRGHEFRVYKNMDELLNVCDEPHLWMSQILYIKVLYLQYSVQCCNLNLVYLCTVPKRHVCITVSTERSLAGGYKPSS
jgi:hypothetical protein